MKNERHIGNVIASQCRVTFRQILVTLVDEETVQIITDRNTIAGVCFDGGKDLDTLNVQNLDVRNPDNVEIRMATS